MILIPLKMFKLHDSDKQTRKTAGNHIFRYKNKKGLLLLVSA